MTNQADVDTLLASINDLKGSWSTSPNGGTNWEEALFRTFYKADGSTADTIPETVVFFTDGVPTFDRLVHKSAPGIIPAEPPAPSAPWPASTGSSYSQVGVPPGRLHLQPVPPQRPHDRCRRRQRDHPVVELDQRPGCRLPHRSGSAGRTATSATPSRYQARYQKRNSSSSARTTGSTRPPIRHDADLQPPQGPRLDRRHRGRVPVVREPGQHQQQRRRAARVVRPAARPSARPSTTPTATNPAYRAVTKTYNNGPDWEIWTGTRTSGNTNEYRSTKIYNSPPYEGYDPAVTASTRNDVILARLIAGNDNGTPATWDGTTYTNAEIADMYVLPQWSQFGKAMEAVALGECGGTLTLQTKIGGTTPAPDPFRYQNSAVTDSAGNPVALEPTVVTTNQQFTTGTFDFVVPNGQFVTVDVLPQNYSELKTYTPGAWSCRAGNQPRSFTPVDIPDGGAWKGVRVRVAANEAVSCTLSVTR